MIRLIVTLTILTITSCVMVPVSLERQSNLEIIIKRESVPKPTTCQPFVWPELQQLPEPVILTDEQLRDTDERAKIFISSIKSLRDILKEDRKKMQEAYDIHKESCKQVQ